MFFVAMNTSDKLQLEERLSQLHRLQKQTEILRIDDEQDTETGYVTDSSINSRKGNLEKDAKLAADETKPPLVNRRKTKSERDKRRSSRISLLDSKIDSGSENSNNSSIEEKQSRYRKRAGSKRVDNITENNNNNNDNNSSNKESHDNRRRRTGSKSTSNVQQQQHLIETTGKTTTNRSSGRDDGNEGAEKNLEESKLDHAPSTTTLRMNSKDIYFGTWNPKERAVLDQVLNNIDLKPDDSTKKSFINKFKWSKEKQPTKSNKEKCQKIEEVFEEEAHHDVIKSPKYPLNKYIDNKDQQHHKKKFGLFRRFKGARKKSEGEDVFAEQAIQDHGNVVTRHDITTITTNNNNNKKKSLFSRLSLKRHKHNEGIGSRSRTHSSNDYASSVGAVLQSEKKDHVTTNLSKSRSTSMHSLRGLFSSSRTKSVDDMDGAFDFYANQKRVFHRTPSMTKLNTKTFSTERLDLSKRSASQKSLDNTFEPARASAKELCYEDSLVFAHAEYVHPQTANQRSIHLPPQRQSSSDGYHSAYEDDFHHRGDCQSGYQSDVSPLFSTNVYQQQHFNYDSFSDSEGFRSNSATSAFPSYYTPNPPRRMVYGASNHQYPPANTSYTHHHSPLMPGFHTPGYATPGYATPGYATPGGYSTPGRHTPSCATPGRQSGYTSENEYYHPLSHNPYSPKNAPASSIMPQHARRAIQRSLSKTSSNYSSNYGYISESSFCEEEEIYGMIHPSDVRQLSGKTSRNSSKTSKISQLSTEV